MDSKKSDICVFCHYARMKKDMPDLKPCPFCGNETEVLEEQHTNGYSTFVAVCGICGASSGSKDTPEEAIESWNRRAGEEDKHEADRR